MSSKSVSTTSIEDLRQTVQGEIVSGAQSVLSTAGGMTVGNNSTVSITGQTGLDVNKTFEQLVSSQESALGKALGLTQSLASGIFESNAGAQNAIAGISSGGVVGSSNMLYAVIAIVIMFIIMRK